MIDKNLKNQIKEMFDVDQKLRKEAFDRTKKEDRVGLYNYLVYLVDGVHGYRVKQIIKKYGYPTTKLVGKKGMWMFWLLVQHQDSDIDLQKKCLNECDFAMTEKAYLEDRILIKEEGKQKFGTQFTLEKKTKRRIPYPIIDRKNLNKRRKQYGLSAFEEYKKRFEKSRKK